jgi:tetratricopeptide (TPR) repeat protein
MKKIVLCFLICVHAVAIFSQKDEAYARQLLNEGMQLMDNGKLDAAIERIIEAKKHGESDFIYDYEIGLAYVWKGDYKTASKYYKNTLKFPNATDQCWQMLGNCYSMMDNPKKAMSVYKKGLKKFPNSGRLYLEQGVVRMKQERYNEAIYFWEKGVDVEPTYGSNYHRMSFIFLHSENEVWGMLYGEILANLEPDSERSEYIRSLMYNTMVSEIQPTDDGYSVSFHTSNILNFSEDMKRVTYVSLDQLFPWGLFAYEPALLLAIAAASPEKINLESINRLRHNFILFYFDEEKGAQQSNVIFDFHKKMIDAGMFEAYNYWLFSPGAPEEFDQWYEENKILWEDFVDWYAENEMTINHQTKFLRTHMKMVIQSNKEE